MSSKTFTPGPLCSPCAQLCGERILIRLAVQRHDLLLRRRPRVEARAATVERGLGHVLDDALGVVALDAGARERRELQVGVERLELVDEALARRVVGVVGAGQA